MKAVTHFVFRSRIPLEPQGLQVESPATRLPFIGILFIIFFVGAWTVGGIGIIVTGIETILTLRGGSLEYFVVMGPLCIWAITDLFLLFFVVWGIGRETLNLESLKMTIGWRLLCFGWRKILNVSKIKDLRLASGGRGGFGGRLCFDYEGKTYGWGRGIDSSDAEIIVEEIRRVAPQLVAGAYRVKETEGSSQGDQSTL